LNIKKQNIHNKPAIFLNIDGFYDGIKIQFERMEREGFLSDALSEYLVFAPTPKAAMNYIDLQYR